MGPRVFHAKFQPDRPKGVGLSHGVGLVIFKKMVPFMPFFICQKMLEIGEIENCQINKKVREILYHCC